MPGLRSACEESSAGEGHEPAGLVGNGQAQELAVVFTTRGGLG